jgi:hypothetical protein
MIPMGLNFFTRSTIPFFLSVAVLVIDPTLFAVIMGNAFFYLLGGSDLLNADIVSIYFNYIAVEGLMPSANGSFVKSITRGCRSP